MGNFADFFPSAPSVIQQRKQEKQHHRRSSNETRRDSTSTTNRGRSSSHVRLRELSEQDELSKATAQSPQHDMRRDEVDSYAGNLLDGSGSATSSETVISGTFSDRLHSSSAHAMNALSNSTLTPLTNSESSPRGKLASPSFAHNPSLYSASRLISPSHATTPQDTKHLAPRPARAEGLLVKGERCVYDPALDKKLHSNPAIAAGKGKAKIVQFGTQPEDNIAPPDPRRSISGYRNGYFSGKGKAKLRVAPYTVKSWGSAKAETAVSSTIAPVTTVVVTGFDPMAPLSQITALFSSFGDIGDIDNKADPATGRFLGICSITYSDCPSFQGGGPLSAAVAAKTAVLEGKRGQRIGTKRVLVEADKDGQVSSKLVETAIARHRRESGFTTTPKIPPPPPGAPPPPSREPTGFAKVDGPPPTAPKGPAAKRATVVPGTQVTQTSLTLKKAPVATTEEKLKGPAVVEEDSIRDQLVNIPYIYISSDAVPVLHTTIPHLKKRLRTHGWKDIRADKTGYFVVFDKGKAGENQASQTYHACHMLPLFTYTMTMTLYLNGTVTFGEETKSLVKEEPRPNTPRAIVRTAPVPAAPIPTSRKLVTTTGLPARPPGLAGKAAQDAELRARRERDFDLDEEKKQRARDLDPSRAVVQLIIKELREKLIEDVKSRLVGPVLHDYLDPDRHIDKRRRLGVEDPPDARRQAASSTFVSRREVHITRHNLPKILKKTGAERGGILPDGRRNEPPQRAVRSLFQQLPQWEDSDSEEEATRTSPTRDTEDPESRPQSRMSMTSVSDSDDEALIKRVQKRKLNKLAREDSDMAESTPIKQEQSPPKQSAHDLRIVKLEEAIQGETNARKRRRLESQLLQWKREKEDEELFGTGLDKVEEYRDLTPEVKDESIAEPTPEPEAITKLKKSAAPKPKKKTKKELAAEREVSRLAALEAEAAQHVEDALEMADEEEAQLVLAEKPPEVEWGVSADHPEPTVDDDEDILADLRGWQASIVDAEDIRLLEEVLQSKSASNIGNPIPWAWKQEQLRTLRYHIQPGTIRRTPAIEGYYVPNLSGSARTEPITKILESEKSKYLPHRIKVQKARALREAEAALVTQPATITAAKAAIEAKASSRGKRADDRRTVREIERQKELFAEVTGHVHDSSSHDDVLKFNALQTRAKPVRFARSAIHNWGLYTQTRISASEMIIEYVGERIRQEVADLREIRYTEQGVGSSYLFRIDEGTVVDATKKGGIARFINHSCDPNCTAKIIKVGGEKRIVIYALRDVEKDEELTYDYKFEREIGSDDRIPCLCGSVNCKGFLN